ncbi:MAG: type IV toxin-antitoxin system AbiEi family antitoxin domain-containing protein [Actinobacteria bacterium]|nr:type IV toxin-antitoxin system AbiEi family antitoxin domain-containing protein [Actinomycetota bacterium]
MDAIIANLARQQLGLITRQQLIALGVTDHWIYHRIRRGLLEVVYPGVYRIAGSPPSCEQSLLAACLAAGDGAAASHEAAAGLWALDGPFRGRLEVVVPRLEKPRPKNVRVHRSTDLVADHLTERRGVPVTKPARTLVDLGAVVGQSILDRAVDDALAKRLVSLEGLLNMLDEVGRRGRRGVGPLRKSLAERTGVPSSVLEAEFQRLVRRYGLPEPVYQYEIRDASGHFAGRVDAAYPELLLAIELDSTSVHGTREALQADLTRQNKIVACGFIPLRYTWADTVGTPERTAIALHRMIDQRRGELGLKIAG